MTTVEAINQVVAAIATPQVVPGYGVTVIHFARRTFGCLEIARRHPKMFQRLNQRKGK